METIIDVHGFSINRTSPIGIGDRQYAKVTEERQKAEGRR
jgi:hypothetical protein